VYRIASTVVGTNVNRFGGEARRQQVALPYQGCRPASRWVKADRLHALVPRGTDRWKALHRGRAAVEREFGTLKSRRR